MILITELLSLQEAASNEAVFHVDTPELRVIEAKTKHAVKFFNDVYFDNEDYQPFKYGTKCYFVVREGAPYHTIRLNFASKQFIANSDKHVTPQELRNLCESYPKLYELFGPEAKKEGVLAAVSLDDIDPAVIEKMMKKNNRHWEFVEQVLATFGPHLLPPKLQDAFLEHAKHSFSERDGFASALLTNIDLSKMFDAKHLVLLMLAHEGSYGPDFIEFLNLEHIANVVKTDTGAMKLLIDELFNMELPAESEREVSARASQLANSKINFAAYITPEVAVEIGVHSGFHTLKKIGVLLDQPLPDIIGKVIDRSPSRIGELDEKFVTNKLKERARLAAMAKARRHKR
jgi:hypothetical protein